jgi:hypothetical protein
MINVFTLTFLCTFTFVSIEAISRNNLNLNKEAKLAVKMISNVDPHKNKTWIFKIKIWRVEME